ncbi:MAG: rRNA maturation RNase YbeY [Saprospiraceae bacterium]|nr:rRNA maturation RNase YbeY [Bacteroidia bacterium]NNF22387.1 rRNA maturation RNase YbeY [Saprospiraceae bacterium]NNK89639.1 rRNA maturation RNase YbeY [Saprospiraceae bacterium]
MDKEVIAFYCEDVDFSLEDKDNLREWLLEVVRTENKTISSLDYIFCSDQHLLEINKKYLDHDYYTDIITFPLNTDPIESNVFISIDRVKENAQLYNQSFIDELHRVIVHGLLHMIGYNDKTQEDEFQMREKENSYLQLRSFV